MTVTLPRPKQGTVSVVFGCHSVIHSCLVLLAWIKLYRRLPAPSQLVCIFLHDIGHWGKDYLNDAELKRRHWELGAALARALFGESGYTLIRGHCISHGVEPSLLLAPDKYSWIIAPSLWMFSNTWFEPKLIRPGCTRMESVDMFKQAMRDNWDTGLKTPAHQIYLDQWESRR